MVPPNSVKMFAYEICNDMKNTGIVNLVVQKFDFWGSTMKGFRGEVAPSNMLKYLCVKYLLISQKKLAPYLEPNKKLIFDGSILGGRRGGGIPK